MAKARKRFRTILQSSLNQETQVRVQVQGTFDSKELYLLAALVEKTADKLYGVEKGTKGNGK